MPEVSEEEWNEDQMVWLSHREMLALAMIVAEVQHKSPRSIVTSPEIMKTLVGAKKKLWAEVEPVLKREETEKLEIDP